MTGKRKGKQVKPRTVDSLKIRGSHSGQCKGRKAKISRQKVTRMKEEKNERLYQTSTFEDPNSREPSPSPTLVRCRTRIPKSNMAFYTSLQDEEIRMSSNTPASRTIGNLERQILAPRSSENDKFKDIYDSIPKLRSVSPPRFTTKGINKKKIDCEILGVKKVGKALGNPYSKFHARKCGIVFGNQTMDSDEKKQKFDVAAASVKNVLKSQASSVRLSSYVQPEQLKKVRDEFSMHEEIPYILVDDEAQTLS